MITVSRKTRGIVPEDSSIVGKGYNLLEVLVGWVVWRLEESKQRLIQSSKELEIELNKALLRDYTAVLSIQMNQNHNTVP